MWNANPQKTSREIQPLKGSEGSLTNRSAPKQPEGGGAMGWIWRLENSRGGCTYVRRRAPGLAKFRITRRFFKFNSELIHRATVYVHTTRSYQHYTRCRLTNAVTVISQPGHYVILRCIIFMRCYRGERRNKV